MGTAQAEGAGALSRHSLAAGFAEHLPRKPYCTDDLRTRIRLRSREIAVRCRYVELNNPAAFSWLTFDVDRPGAYFADGDANLPPASVVTVNRENGHAHLGYLLAAPVARHQMARFKPLEFYAAVQRGFTNRLEADKNFAGLITKNPLHPIWLTEWRRAEPYSLSELNDWLFDRDKRFDPRPETQFGAGRNVTTFTELRTLAYREVLNFKRAGADLAAFRERLEAVALGINTQFVRPLRYSEIRAIAKSVAKWVWRRFSPERFLQIQSARGRAGMASRWADHVAASTTVPWLALGISRATWYRRQRARGCQ